jgi:hypothetical protein
MPAARRLAWGGREPGTVGLEEGLETYWKMSGFPEKILLASDASESTTPAARAAVDLAKKGGAELHVVYVWRTVPSPHFGQVKRSGLEVAGCGALE